MKRNQFILAAFAGVAMAALAVQDAAAVELKASHQFPGGKGEQLFDLIQDPDEQNNVGADPRYRQTREALREELINQIVLQDYPHPRRSLFAIGVH